MRYQVFNAVGENIGQAESAQESGDIATNHIAANQNESFAWSADTNGGAFPFVRYTRLPYGGFLGTPFRTVNECLKG